MLIMIVARRLIIDSEQTNDDKQNEADIESDNLTKHNNEKRQQRLRKTNGED